MDERVKALYQAFVELHIAMDALSDIRDILIRLGFYHYGNYLQKLIDLYQVSYQKAQEELDRAGFRSNQLN